MHRYCCYYILSYSCCFFSSRCFKIVFFAYVLFLFEIVFVVILFISCNNKNKHKKNTFVQITKWSKSRNHESFLLFLND